MGANIDSTQRRCTIPSRRGRSFILYKNRLIKSSSARRKRNTILFNIIVPGETIPHHSLISPKEYHGTAIALIKTEVEPITSSEWYERLQANPESYANIAMQLQSKLRMMQQRIDQLTTVSPKERLHRLQEWFTLYLGDIPIYEILTQTEIG